MARTEEAIANPVAVPRRAVPGRTVATGGAFPVSGTGNCLSVALLTGGSDKPYALGLASALSAEGVCLDFIGSDELDCPEVHAVQRLRFLNLRGDQRENASLGSKVSRVLRYYWRLLRYSASTNVAVLHILWNNKFELFDRTALMLFYRLMRKRVVLTAHNINVAARDGGDNWLNVLSLRSQYRLCDHVFVHTESMRLELMSSFRVPGDRITVIPFGVNDTVPRTALTPCAARRRLGLAPEDRALLFFGQIAPYKGLEYLVSAVAMLAGAGEGVRLIIAGKVKRGSEGYWAAVQRDIVELGIEHLIILKIQFIPDAAVEQYFKAADAVVVPYISIFQSGVPFLAFSFGVPVIATDVGSFREDITHETGILCRPRDANDLARAIGKFYDSELWRDRVEACGHIRRIAEERHSWGTVAKRTVAVYAPLMPHHPDPVHSPHGQAREAPPTSEE